MAWARFTVLIQHGSCRISISHLPTALSSSSACGATWDAGDATFIRAWPTRGEGAERAIARHLELAGELIGEALGWHAEGPPGAPVRGDELAAGLGIEPGPRLGELLGALTEAAYAGEIAGPAEAIAYARGLSDSG